MKCFAILTLSFCATIAAYNIRTKRQDLCQNIDTDEYFRVNPGDGENCRTVVRCSSNGELKTIRCPTGLYFDIDTQLCEWADRVQNCQIKNKKRQEKPNVTFPPLRPETGVSSSNDGINTNEPENLRPTQKACKRYMELSANKIKGGTSADVEEFPWMAALGYVVYRDNNYVVNFECGGTIVSSLFILTACHCVELNHSPVLVRLGKTSLDDSDGIKPENYQIKEIMRHNEYSAATKKNDIALIRLVKSIYFSNKVAPACLETSTNDVDYNVKLIVTGWGYTDQDAPSNQLRKAELTTMTKAECNETLLDFNQNVRDKALENGISESQYCSYDPQGKQDSCNGDSGGPLQYFPFKHSTISKVVGVISFGFGCASGKPGINTRVASYLDWIESFVWPNGFVP